MGHFFSRVAGHLRRLGAKVSKVNFNAGDELYFPGPDAVPYRGTLAAWPDWFESFVRERQVDVVFLFGDCRPVHRAAIERARAMGLDVWVFEEGYLRPDWVTFERGGVNGYSGIPRDPDFYRALQPTPLPEPRSVGQVFGRSARFAITYALVQWAFSWRFPHYRHHRNVNPWVQAAVWVRGGLRKLKSKVRDRAIGKKLEAGTMPPYYVVPLQVHLDSQIGHSPYAQVADFIEQVVTSFARFAPGETHLVIKHHPMDRAYCDYSRLIASLAERLGLRGRLHYVDVVNLPATLRNALGTIVINSTVGMSSLHHRTAVKCMGTAVYDMPGLTFQGSLDDFWKAPGEVDRALLDRFRWWLRTNNQLNGSVWTDLFLDE